MSWNYRVCRYTTQGVVLVSLVEVYYNAAGEPESYGLASVTDWETVEDLRGTVALMQEAFTKPVLDIRADMIAPYRVPDDENPELTAEDFAQMRPAREVLPELVARAMTLERCPHCGHEVHATAVTHSVVVDQPGRPVAAPCALLGCHYGHV